MAKTHPKVYQSFTKWKDKKGKRYHGLSNVVSHESRKDKTLQKRVQNVKYYQRGEKKRAEKEKRMR